MLRVPQYRVSYLTRLPGFESDTDTDSCISDNQQRVHFPPEEMEATMHVWIEDDPDFSAARRSD